MDRAVFDTNVLVSAILRPGSVPARVLELAAEGSVQAVLSPAIVAEYEAVLGRRRFGLSPATVAAIIGNLRKTAVEVVPCESVQACGDPADDKFLECAVAAGAEFLVTGNRRHFPQRWGKVRVVSPAVFLQEAEGL